MDIVNENDNVVIVLGAGASISEMDTKSYRGKLPPTDMDFLKRARECCPKSYAKLTEAFDEVWGGGEPYPIKHQRMEQLFASSFLKVLQTQGQSKAARDARSLLDNLVIALRDTILATTDRAKPEQHVKLFRHLHEKANHLSVVSLNYDLLADRALRIGSQRKHWHWHHSDGYGFQPDNQPVPRKSSEIELLKLHGSLNWFNPIRSKWRNTAYNPKAPIYIPKPARNRNAAAWHKRQNVMGTSRTRIFPLLVPPVYEKGTQIHGTLTDVWDRASDLLEEATLVIVWGYSIPVTDYHAEVLFAQSARKSKFRLLVVNPDPAALGRVTYVCGHRWNRWFFRAEHLLNVLDEI